MEEAADSAQTCGQGLAANAVLPVRMAALVAATADVLSEHMAALDEHDSDARAERVAYQALVAAHRDVAERLETLARHMESNRDLPPAPHNEEVMRHPSGQAAAFERSVREQRQLAELLNTMITESEALVD